MARSNDAFDANNRRLMHSKTQPDDASTLLHIFHFPRCAMLEYTRRASSHGGAVNRVRSGTKQPQPFSASAEGSGSSPLFSLSMTYQVLARKWRPKDFASLVGQAHVV